MAGKGTRMAGQRLGYALDKLSKNALIDLVADRARAEIGEDAPDEALADLIQQWINPVAIVREDRPILLRGEMERLDKIHAEYRRRQEPHECAHRGCGAIITGGDLCFDHAVVAKLGCGVESRRARR